MNFLFRVDGGQAIGSGHAMRCLTLADRLSRNGARCRFVIREHPGHPAGLLRERGHEVTVLPLRGVSATPGGPAHAAWLGVDWEVDVADTVAGLGDDVPEWVIVDHYGIDARWEAVVRGHCRRIMVIDDLADRRHDCDLLLDQNIVAGADSRYDGIVPAGCGRMIGPRFALLQSAYADLRPRVMPRSGPIRRVLVFFGGGDTAAVTERALSALLPMIDGSFSVDVVVGGRGGRADTLRARVSGVSGVTLHESIPSLAPLVAAADLALGAGGTAALERCCLGVPSIIVTLADNQRPIAAELDRQGLATWLGDEADVAEADLSAALADALDAGSAREMSLRCLAKVTGRGTEAVAGFLLLDRSTPLMARPVAAADEELLLEWANDPAVRANSFTSSRIDAESHRRWLHGKMENRSDCRLFVIETGAGLPIGQVRFDRHESTWEISYSIDPRARGRGIGRPLVECAIGALGRGDSAQHLVARVKPMNLASRRVFEGMGFRPIAEEPIIVFERRPLPFPPPSTRSEP